MGAKLTAVEWLYHQIVIKNSDVLKFRQYLEQAKAMEKEQMMQCYEDGYNRVVKLIEDATQKNLNL